MVANSFSFTAAGRHARTGGIGLVLVCAALVGGCKTMKVGSADFIVPDSKLATNKRPVPARNLEPLRARLPAMNLEERHFRAGDGVALRALVYRHPAAQATVLVYGNNAFRVAQQGQVILEALAPLPLNVVQFDYRGYGASEGEPTTDSIKADALAVYDQVRKDLPGPIILHGHSFGSFVASFVASKRDPDAVVLEGTTTSAVDFIHNLTPWYAKPFVRFEISDSLVQFDNRVYLSAYQGQLLVLAGENDKQTVPQHARHLFDAAPAKHKVFYEIPGATHMNAMRSPEARSAYATLLEVLKSARR